MGACPNCGHEAGDEVVCTSCGTFLGAGADGDDSDAFMDDLGFSGAGGGAFQDVKTWRIAAFVAAVCVLAVATAIVLLHLGSSTHKQNVALPLPDTSASSTPFVPPPISSFAEPTYSAPPSARASTSASRSKSASPTPTKTARPSATPTPSPSPSHSSSATHTSPAPSTSSTTPPSQSVALARGASCGPHCFQLQVTLIHFPPGVHGVECWSQRSGQFASYSTVLATSTNCMWSQRHDVVWVVVDGNYESNHVTW